MAKTPIGFYKKDGSTRPITASSGRHRSHTARPTTLSKYLNERSSEGKATRTGAYSPRMLQTLKDLGVPLNAKTSGHKKFVNKPYMDLNIDWWPEGKNLRIAVAHNSIQEGDVMADPDMEFRYTPEGNLIPMTYQNDYAGKYDDSESPAAIRSRAQFSEMWAKNIRAQGFIKR